MANYPFISAKVVLARTIRNLGYKLPSTYIDDILEWIPEAMGEMEVTQSLVRKTTGDPNCEDELYIRNHCVNLPCGFRVLLSLENSNGKKLRKEGYANTKYSTKDLARVSTFNVNPFQHQTSDGLPVNQPDTRPPWYTNGEDIVKSDDWCDDGYYSIVGNSIQTSFEEGFVKLDYLAIPTCKEGYPLIPNNENFKQAIEWHLIKRLIGSGYEHKVFSYQMAAQEFEKYAGRAMGEVSFYTPDDAAKLNRTIIKLYPPTNFHNDFFTV